MKITAVILAAGQGTRMNSDLPKVLHPVCGVPMIAHSLAAVKAASSETPVVIIGHGAEAVREFLGEKARCVVQDPQLGTGHAVQQAESILRGKTDLVLVTYADMPLLRPETIKGLVETQKANKGPLTMLTVSAADPRGFGRVVRAPGGSVQAIVEEAAATEEQLSIHELNVGAYCFSADWLWEALHKIKVSPHAGNGTTTQKGEYYLTDTVALAVQAGLTVQALVSDDLVETIGINTRVHLAEAELAMRQRINRAHMLAGVTIVDPASTYIELGIKIGRDTVIWPNTYLRGKTVIGEGCVIGPNTIAEDTTVGDCCEILAAVMEGAVVEDNVGIGPFARLRKGAHLCKGVHVGNFGEVKDSTLGPGTKMGHFSYIGNATIGDNVNIGAGTVTCNYDGVHKNQTEIGEDVFIGSDTMLVAPVKIGARSRTGAGAVVTKDVEPDTLVVGVPARPIKKLNEAKDD
ncbi:MAG: bifunctional UDP-N-acetylglucosamine diphosphorylase/glucosamine-1-phosphate N-acetyltransferase GlmU [Candidatus Atribacteria bacterium]|nr:bifunctional UDP-N-acetylglucosamine diphosphorylase/glucosamine-1-phosphate N-acetyltransferase GlmU [Candidatus Atribacteria bacterium]